MVARSRLIEWQLEQTQMSSTIPDPRPPRGATPRLMGAQPSAPAVRFLAPLERQCSVAPVNVHDSIRTGGIAAPPRKPLIVFRVSPTAVTPASASRYDCV